MRLWIDAEYDSRVLHDVLSDLFRRMSDPFLPLITVNRALDTMFYVPYPYRISSIFFIDFKVARRGLCAVAWGVRVFRGVGLGCVRSRSTTEQSLSICIRQGQGTPLQKR